MTTRDTAELNDDVATDVTPGPVETKRTAKLAQLASARQSMKDKKRKRDDDISSIVTKIDEISNRLDQQQQTKPPEQEEPPAEKRQRVTSSREEDVGDNEEPTSDSWTTSIVRTGAVLTLSAVSWYMQNMYGKPPTTTTRKIPEKKKHRRRYPRKYSCSLTICKLRVTVR